ncbi:MAG: T9SS type A sorting domain-containing protein, partial [Bacteroidia bacterium]
KETGAKSVVVKGRGINGPDGIFYDWDGNMMVSNWNNHKIHIVNPDGSTTLFANIPVGGFMGYALLIGDYIYVPSVGHKKLYRIDKSGNVEHIAGSGAIGSDDGNGLAASFVGPNGTCKSPTGDTLLISDDHRIRIVTKLTEGTSTAITSIIATDFTVSPNPVSDMLHITWSIEAQSELNYEIYTIEGSKIMLTGKTKVSQGKAEVDIDVTQLKRGLYFITFTDSKGRQLSHNFLKS